MATPIVLVEHVRKRFGATVAVDDLSLDIARGEMFGLIGPDGAGKTTTIRLICGLLRADAGTIRVLGHDPVAAHAAPRVGPQRARRAFVRAGLGHGGGGREADAHVSSTRGSSFAYARSTSRFSTSSSEA